MRARGRHGTHSPFVYAFVEQVMRARAGSLPQQGHLPRSVFRLLYKTIKHLKPATVYTTSELYPALQLIEGIVPETIDVVLMPSTGLPQSAVAGALVCMAGREEEEALLKQVLQVDEARVLVIGPHLHKARFVTWSRLAAMPEVDMSLDYWYLGLLVNDPAFKAKQHFRLR